MQNEPRPESINIQTAAEFDRKIRTLAKKYRHIKSDLQPLITALQSGETPGDLLTGLTVTAFKIRLKNSDTSRGKSGGYRVVYYVALSTQIVLLTVYSKSEQEDVAAKEIESIVAAFHRQAGEIDC